MANKLAALLVICLVFVAAVELPKAVADDYAKCFKECEQECIPKGHGYTFCEMKCDTDCFTKDVDSKLTIKFP